MAADRKRLSRTSAIGLGETSLCVSGAFGTRVFVTTVANVERHQVIDFVPSSNYAEVTKWIEVSNAWKLMAEQQMDEPAVGLGIT